MHFPTTERINQSIKRRLDEKMKNEMWFLTTSRQIKARLIIAALFKDGMDGNGKKNQTEDCGFRIKNRTKWGKNIPFFTINPDLWRMRACMRSN